MASDRKSTQRQRLIDALIATAGKDGYDATNIARIHKHAAVSRPTYYEYFPDKEACLVGALEQIGEELVLAVANAVEASAPDMVLGEAVSAVLAFADGEPAKARVLYDDSMRGGGLALDVRDGSLASMAATIGRARGGTRGAGAAVPAIDASVLLGGILRVLAPRLRTGKRGHKALAPGLLAWTDGYAGGRDAADPAVRAPELPAVRIAHRPPQIAAGEPMTRRALPRAPALQRTRILGAIAELAQRDGYRNLTVAAVTDRAGVKAHAFSRHFPSKESAYAALHDLYYQQLMAVVASAASPHRTWPRRIWDATRTAAQYLDENPRLAQAMFVSGYQAGDEAISQIETGTLAFTLYLEEGHRYGLGEDQSRGPDDPAPDAAGASPPRIALEAIARTVFEIGYRTVRAQGRGENATFHGAVPDVVCVALAPFVGATEARRLIAELVVEARGSR
jgi:AcrR family transcriptional regulator